MDKRNLIMLVLLQGTLSFGMQQNPDVKLLEHRKTRGLSFLNQQAVFNSGSVYNLKPKQRRRIRAYHESKPFAFLALPLEIQLRIMTDPDILSIEDKIKTASTCTELYENFHRFHTQELEHLHNNLWRNHFSLQQQYYKQYNFIPSNDQLMQALLPWAQSQFISDIQYKHTLNQALTSRTDYVSRQYSVQDILDID